MGYSGFNLGNVKISNRSSILKLLNDHGAMSRKDIAEATGLTPAAVTLICTELLSAGILVEKGEMEEEKRAGRKKVLIDINYQYRYVLSISIEANTTCVTISDLEANCLAIRKIPTDPAREPEQFLKNIVDEGKALMWEQGINKEQVLGVGVSVWGVVDRKNGVSQHAFRVWSEPVAVRDILKKYMDYPVIVENNIRAFAEAELIYGSGKKQDNLLFIKWGPGVGSAIIVQNQIYRGNECKAGEIGHMIMVKNGKKCHCGRKGCLETRVATHPIAERVREACTPERMPVLYEALKGNVDQIQARNMREWVTIDDPGMWQILDAVIEELAMMVVNTFTFQAPDQVICFGEVFDMPRFYDKFMAYCEQHDSSYTEGYIVKSSLADRFEYIGPAAVVVNELFLMGKSSDAGEA